MSTPPNGDLTVPLSIVERERLNEWAAEVEAGVDELARRLILRYLYAARERDALEDRIGQTLLARAAQTSQIPPDASEKLREAMGDLGLTDRE